MNGEKIMLAVFPREAAAYRYPGTTPLHLAWRLGPDGTLLRHRLADELSGGVMGVLGEIPTGPDPAVMSDQIAAACRAAGFTGVFLDQARPDPAAVALCEALVPRLGAAGWTLFVRPPLARADAVVFFSSQVTGGSYPRYLEEQTGRCGGNAGLELTPLAAEFVLPGDGRGMPLSRETLAARLTRYGTGHRSPELTARYLTCTAEDGGTRLLLWDDTASLIEKLRLARAAGIRHFLLPAALLGDRLPPLLADA